MHAFKADKQPGPGGSPEDRLVSGKGLYPARCVARHAHTLCFTTDVRLRVAACRHWRGGERVK